MKHSRITMETGFTLIEMIVVIFLMGLSLTLFLGYNYDQLDSVRLRTTTKNIYQLFKSARSFAMLDGRINDCTFVPQTGVISQSLRKKQITLPEHVNIILDPSPEDDSLPVILTSFYPDGTAVQNKIMLATKKHKIILEIKPVLGKVVVSKKSTLLNDEDVSDDQPE